ALQREINQMTASLLDNSGLARWVGALALGIVLLLVYAPTLTKDYLYHDDWVQVADRDAHCRALSVDELNKGLGRPGAHFVLCGLYELFNTVSQAWRARLVLIGVIIALAVVQWFYFEAIGIGALLAACLALGTAVLP